MGSQHLPTQGRRHLANPIRLILFSQPYRDVFYLCLHTRGCDQPAQVGIPGLGFGQQRQVRAVHQRDLGADDYMQGGAPRRRHKTDGPAQAVVVGQRQRTQTLFDCRLDEFFG